MSHSKFANTIIDRFSHETLYKQRWQETSILRLCGEKQFSVSEAGKCSRGRVLGERRKFLEIAICRTYNGSQSKGKRG